LVLTSVEVHIHKCENLCSFRQEFYKPGKHTNLPILNIEQILICISINFIFIFKINFRDYSSNDWYCEWLNSPREDGKPRLLVLHVYDFRSISAFIEQIKKVNPIL
jgi:hypothetical protein